MFLLDSYIFINIVFKNHFNYNLYIIHVIQSSDCKVFLFLINDLPEQNYMILILCSNAFHW